jgi:hypothetical protein
LMKRNLPDAIWPFSAGLCNLWLSLDPGMSIPYRWVAGMK